MMDRFDPPWRQQQLVKPLWLALEAGGTDSGRLGNDRLPLVRKSRRVDL